MAEPAAFVLAMGTKDMPGTLEGSKLGFPPVFERFLEVHTCLLKLNFCLVYKVVELSV